MVNGASLLEVDSTVNFSVVFSDSLGASVQNFSVV